MISSLSFNFQRFIKQSIFIFKVYLIGLIFFLTARIIFIIKFGHFKELSEFKFDFAHSFITGIRFDSVILTYLLLVLFLFSILNLFLKEKYSKVQNIIDKIFIIYSVIILAFIALIIIIDHYFYQFFISHINITFFGIIDDDTKAVFKSIWIDYPLIRVILFISILVVALHFFLKKKYYKQIKFKIEEKKYQVAYLFLFFGLYFMGMRCSFGNVPLEFMEASISPNSFINNITMNGVFALKNANDEYNKGQIDISDAYLKKFNFISTDEMLKEYRKYFCSNNNFAENIDSIAIATTPTNKFLEENPPNIVFLQMESMSSYYFKLHSKKFNLLGKLEDEIKKCIVYKNFVSCKNYTIFSMDGLIINSQLTPFSQSKFLNTKFSTSSILPFQKYGYKTVFLTGGRLNWRNLNYFLPLQGFEEMEGGADIISHISGTKDEHEWGVYDEFIMKRIIQKLNEPKSKPLFIYGVTITNHTPYKTPSNYKAFPLAFGPHFTTPINSTDESVRQTFLCYQYMCNSLGWLIHEITTSKLAENTIIVVTGDHSSHVAENQFGFLEKNLLNKLGVPLIFYIPPKYRDNIYIDTLRFGSHKDIFPTLYNLALSNAKYYSLGNNLFSTDSTIKYFGLYETGAVFCKYGCSVFTNNYFLYYNWLGKQGEEQVYITDNIPETLVEYGNMGKAYSAFNHYLIIKQLNKTKNH